MPSFLPRHCEIILSRLHSLCTYESIGKEIFHPFFIIFSMQMTACHWNTWDRGGTGRWLLICHVEFTWRTASHLGNNGGQVGLSWVCSLWLRSESVRVYVWLCVCWEEWVSAPERERLRKKETTKREWRKHFENQYLASKLNQRLCWKEEKKNKIKRKKQIKNKPLTLEATSPKKWRKSG